MVSMSNINVLVNVKIIDRSAFSLWIDPSKIGNHFGNTPDIWNRNEVWIDIIATFSTTCTYPIHNLFNDKE